MAALGESRQEAAFALLEANMAAHYAKSDWGWDPDQVCACR